MASEFRYPRPDNVRGRFGTYVDADVFNIAHRLQEVDPNLAICVLDEPLTLGNKTWLFAIVEMTPWGEKLVYRTAELDARIIEHCQYLLKVPFEKRFAEAERIEAKAEAERKEAELDQLYEDMGGQMRIDLARCGFTGPIRESYPLMNRTARRHRRQHESRAN